ncbi:DUF6003 family protein [Streptomyces flavofungini]|uniref:DUF6003 family protein n=1 Tax=Streptomyces flavofungini TaxID=68200 RepID=UPI0034DF74AB
MADDACLFLLPERHPLIGAPLAAVGDLECGETPAVQGWLHAHGVSASSELVRILPAETEAIIPEEAERLPVPLSPDETIRVQQACAPRSVTDIESELLDFRDTTRERESLVHRALTAGIPAPRIAQLTGLDPREVGRLTQG